MSGRIFGAALIAGVAWLRPHRRRRIIRHRSITVVVPFPAGGPSDVVARIVTEQMGKHARPDRW